MTKEFVAKRITRLLKYSHDYVVDRGILKREKPALTKRLAQALGSIKPMRSNMS